MFPNNSSCTDINTTTAGIVLNRYDLSSNNMMAQRDRFVAPDLRQTLKNFDRFLPRLEPYLVKSSPRKMKQVEVKRFVPNLIL